eukprot:scaffold5539_cov76-Amphora_coffeaeformis.AAC.1
MAVPFLRLPPTHDASKQHTKTVLRTREALQPNWCKNKGPCYRNCSLFASFLVSTLRMISLDVDHCIETLKA